MQKNTLYIVSTPIGNLDDITIRALNTLKSCTLLVCEDTRVTKKLLNHFNITNKKLISYANHNLQNTTPKIIQAILNGELVALVSDAGTPLISDPGEQLILDCYKNNIKVCPVVGANSVTAALVISGLPTIPFYFGGFLPNTNSLLQETLVNIKKIQATLILFETKHRLLNSLQKISNIFGEEANISVVREITKLYEEVIKDSVKNVINHFANTSILGEFVILIDNNTPTTNNINDEKVKQELLKELQNNSTKVASTKIALEYGLSKGDVYTMALSLKSNKNNEKK